MMTMESMQPEKTSGKKSRKFFPAFCRFTGTFILIAVIVVFLPLTVPRLAGYEAYEVVSGSMEPEIPVGSVIYVKPAEPEEIEKEDIIAFQRGDSVITHRVVENRVVTGEFVTRGDANQTKDMNPVPYENVIGKVVRSVPGAGVMAEMFTSREGKILAGGVIAAAVLLQIVAALVERR